MTAIAQTSTPLARRPTWQAWTLFSPMLAWLLLFVVAPTAILLVYSFFRGTGIGDFEVAFTFENYRKCFHAPYPAVLGLSLWYAVLTTALCLIVGYPAAYYIGRSTPVKRDRLLMLVMVPFWTSFLIRAYAWMTILSHDGWLNAFLHATPIIPFVLHGNVEWLYTPKAVIIALVYSYLPFMILPIYGSVEKLDTSLIEAASDLGASPAATFWRVILPLTMPGVQAGILMVFVPAIAMFAVTSLMSGGNVVLIGDEIQRQFDYGNLPFCSALGMMLLLLFVVTYLLFMRRGIAHDRTALG